jgi:peptidyl-prolyl cis-trans isomerase D
MIKFFSRLERTRNVVLIVFAVVMVVSLIVAGSLLQDQSGLNLTTSTATAAKVGSERITVGEVATLKQGRGASVPAKFLLNSLISQRLVRIEAARLGLTPSDAEVAEVVRERMKDEKGNTVDRKQYERFAVTQAGSIKAYEDSIRDELAAQKLEAYLTAGVTVSEEEVIDDFKRKNTKFDLNYVAVSASELASAIKPTDEQLRSYFDKNKAAYYISSPQRKVAYIYVDTVKVGEKLALSDEDLRQAYDRIPDDKRRKGVEGQEIVLRVARPEMEPGVLAKASELIATARKDGDIVSEEAFAELAKGHSEDARSAAAGGKLRGPVRENQQNPNDPYQRLLGMKEGQVTEPIVYQGRVFILRRGKDVPKTFEDAKPELVISLRNTKADTANSELSEEIKKRLVEVKDVRKVAAEFAARANMRPADMVRETPFIKPGDNVDKVGVNPQFEEAIGVLNNPNDVGDKLRITGGFAVPMLLEKQEPRDSTFDEVKDKVVEAVKQEEARNRVEQVAKDIASAASSAVALSGAASAKGLKSGEQKPYSLGSTLGSGPDASTSEELENAIYALKEGEVTKTPIKLGDSWYVVGVTKREDANMDDFAKERDSLFEQKLSEKKSRFFYDYLSDLRQRKEKDGEIVIYKEQLARLDETPEIPGAPAQ